jgi:8-oxo-dGTP pyrophosphatase MutT (NUDIX family)
LILDEQNCLLLYRFTVPVGHLTVWTPPGGGIEKGESHLQALARELDEEVGLQPSGNPAHVWHQHVEMPDLLDGYDGVVNDYYLLRTKRFTPHGSLGDAELARELVGDFDWWSVEQLRDRRGDAVFGPRDLPALMSDLVESGVPSQPLSIGL